MDLDFQDVEPRHTSMPDSIQFQLTVFSLWEIGQGHHVRAFGNVCRLCPSSSRCCLTKATAKQGPLFIPTTFHPFHLSSKVIETSFAGWKARKTSRQRW